MVAESGVEIIETLPLKKNKSTVITGFAGPGFVGSAAIMHIVRSKGLKQRAYVRSQLIPPMMLLIDGQPVHAFRIYSGENDDVLLVTSEALLMHENAWPVSLKLADWLIGKGAEAFVSVEGIPFGVPSRERTILGFSTDRDLNQLGVQIAREGAVSGMNACMLEECMKRRVSWTTLFIPTNVMATIDFGGAAAVVDVLNRMFKLGVDVSPLRDRDEMMRKATEAQRAARDKGFLGKLKK